MQASANYLEMGSLSMDLSDEDPFFSSNESDYEENYNSCGN